MAPLMLKGICRFWSNTCCHPDDVFFRDVAAYFTNTMLGPSLHKLQQCITVWEYIGLPAIPTCPALKMCGATQTTDCRATEVVIFQFQKLQHCFQTQSFLKEKMMQSSLQCRECSVVFICWVGGSTAKPHLAGQESLLCPGLPSGLHRGEG